MVLESNTLDVLFVKDGQQGEDGKVLYTWIKYAKDANGTGMTDDPNGAIYIGISYNNESSIESNDPTQYAWTKIQGADGKKGEDAYTIFLENENISFATDKNRNPLSEQAYTSGITIMKGAKPVTDFIIGDIAKTQGIAVAKTDTAIAISVVNGNPLPNDSGEIEIPITVGGTVFKKILTWTCAKKGDQGERGLQGIQGPQGEQGIAGKDGTSVTIINKSITYQLSTSGTVIPTGTWQTSPQTIPEGQYQWTKTSVTYSDGNQTESYSISYHGKNGSDGTSVKTTSTSVKYQVGDSGTTKPTGTWQSNVPTVAQGKYLWTQTIVNYSDGNSTESYSVSYRGIDGSNGVNGMNAATIYLYQRATSTPSKPSNTLTYTFSTTKITGTLNNGWSTAIPTGTDAVYVTVASVSSKNDTTTIATSAWSAPVVLAQNGKTGSDGKAGLNVATIYLYQRNTSKPSKPSASVTYTFSTGVASGLNNGWSQKIPDGTNPLYVTLATASSNTATDTILSSEWSDVVVMAQNGEDGQDGISPKVSLSKTGDTTTISIVDATGTHTQTVKDGTNGTPGEAGKDGKTSYFHVKYSNDGGKTFTGNSGEDAGIYMGSYTDYTEGDSTDVSKYTWVKVKGDKGDTGQKGDNAKNLSITPSSQYFKSTDGGKTFAPNTITIKPTIQGEINFGKWQYSIDGGVSFADVVNRQKGLTISNNVLTVSRDSSLYSDAVTMVTFRAVASDSSFYDTCSIAKIYDVSDIQIGGRNLAKKGCIALWDDSATFNDDTFSEDGSVVFSRKSAAANSGVIIDRYVNYEKDEHYIVSFKMRVTSGTVNSFYLWNGKGHTNNSVYVDGIKSGTLHADVSFPTDDQYHQITAYFTATGTTSTEASDIDINHHLILQPIKGTAATYTVQLLNFKIEKGNKATDWTPAPEDVQTAILSTKSEISDVSSQVDKNKQAIEQRVTKTTYQQDLTFVKGDISKANEGLNKWRYEIYPKSLFASEYQGKSTMDVFAKNTNLTPSQSVLINDTDLSIAWNYDNNYIGYALTFAKFSAAKSVAITFAHDDGAHIYLNGKLIGGSDAYSQTGESLTLGFVKGWNCIEVVVNEGASTEGFKLGTTISAISECQLMNCYYGTPVARQSHITNQLVENTTNIKGVTTTMQKVMTTVGGSDRIDEFVNNYNKTIESEKQFKKTIGETYTTKDEFNGLEIGGRNLLTKDDCNMSKWQNLYPVHCKVTNNDYSNHIDYVPTSGEWEIVYKKISITKGQKYILSFDYKVNKAYNYLSGQKYGVYLSTSIPTNAAPINIITDGQYVIENTVTSLKRGVITFTAPIDTLYIVINGGCIDDNQTGLSFEFNKWKLEKGNKATNWTPAPEDNEINGQNLVSNLPSNWEQGGINGGQAVGSTYASIKSSTTYRIRIKDIFSVSGNIAVSAGGTTTNSAKETLTFYGTLYDAKKGLLRETGWKSFPSTINCGDAKYMSIILRWGDGTKTQITPPDISQICLKIERGTSATPFTLAPEDVNGKIVNVETIANQTAKKFEWIVKGGDSSSNFTLTDRVADLVAERINFNGLVKFSGLAKSTQDKINSPTSGNLITVSPTNPISNYDNTTFSIVSDDVGGRCIQTTAQFVPFTNYASNIFKPGEQIYYNINVPNWSSTTFDANLGIWFFTAEKKCVANSCTRVTLQRTTWNRLSGYITVPTSGWSGIIYYVIGIENPNKYQLGLVSNSYIEKTTSYATTYASSAVNWVTNNGSSTTSLNSMVKKWTDGAVSDTTQINGGWIKANTITASKIAVGDFTNYADINESNTYGFSVEKTTDGVWFSKDGSKLTRDNYISKMYSCEPGQTFYVEYDISNTIKDSTEYKAAGIMLFGCDGTQTVKWYQRRGAVVGTAAGTVTHMSQQLTMPSGTRFFYVVLQIEGFQPFTGTLKIRNLSVRKAVTGAVIVDGSITADKIATDAIKSRNYISSGGTQGSFLNLKDGSFTSPNLSWDANGNLIAKTANLSGQINATKGTVGGWNIATNGLYSGIDENAIKIYSATTYDAQTMYQKQKIQDSFILSQKYINHFVSQQVSVGHNIPYWQTRSFIYNDSQIQLAQSDYCINTSSASNYDAQYSLKDGYISATRIYMKQNITQVGGDVINSSFSIGLDSMMGWCSIQSTKGINIYGNSSRALYVQSNDTSKYNALETEGDVVVNGKIHAVSGDNKIQLNSDNNGSIELYGNTPFIDFHSAYSSADYTCRIIANTPEQLLVCGKLRCDSNIISNNDLIANSWVYAGQNAHYTWQNQLDCYFSCGYYNNTNNIYYYAGYHAFYVNGDSGSGMMYIDTSGVSSRKGFRNSSDERIKQNFSHFDDNFIDTYMSLEPVQYQFKNDTDDKYHFGFKAQQTERILNAYGQESDKSYGICATHAIDSEKAEKLYGVKDMHEEYTLAYDELIAPTTYMVQHTYKELESTKDELTKVKQEKADLEARLQAIEAKLGL